MFDTVWKYRDYIKFASLNNLQTRYKNMYLGVLWIILDPILYVVVLALVNLIIFDRITEQFLVYILIGMVAWNFFRGTLIQGSNSIFSRMGIIEQIAIPKNIFPLIDLITQMFVFGIGFILILISMAIFHIPFTWHIIEVIPITAIVVILLYGLAMTVAHFGAIIGDFKIGLTYLMYLLFFLTPIWYDFSTVAPDTQQILMLNPATVIIQSYRDVLITGTSPDYLILSTFFIFGILFILLGNYLIRKNDKKYVMMK